MAKRVIVALVAALVAMADAQEVGSPQLRIVGGQTAESDKYPWMVALQRAEGSEYVTFCGGTVIHPNYVLTAGHCVKRGAKPSRIVVGKANLKNTNGAEIRDHEQITVLNYEGNYGVILDVALIYFENALPNSIRPISINADRGNELERPSNTESELKVRALGWGFTRAGSGKMENNLRQVDLPLVSASECKEAYGTAFYDYNLCAGFAKGGQDSCSGDSGGPLVSRDPATGEFVQVGIVSWGRSCALPRNYGVYSRVSFFHNWILRKVGGNLLQPGQAHNDKSGSVNLPVPVPTLSPTIRRCKAYDNRRDLCEADRSCEWHETNSRPCKRNKAVERSAPGEDDDYLEEERERSDNESYERDDGHGESHGAPVGAIIGASAGALAVVGVAVFAVMRKSRATAAKPDVEHDPEADTSAPKLAEAIVVEDSNPVPAADDVQVAVSLAV